MTLMDAISLRIPPIRRLVQGFERMQEERNHWFAVCQELTPERDRLQRQVVELERESAGRAQAADDALAALERERAERAQAAVDALATSEDAVLDNLLNNIMTPRALGPRLTGLRLLLLGTCQLGPLVDAANILDHSADHMLLGSEQHDTVPVLDVSQYDAAVVALTLRHLYIEATGAAYDVLHARGLEAADAAAALDRCIEITRDRVELLHASLKGIPLFFTAFYEPSFDYLGNLCATNDPSDMRIFVRRLNEALAGMLQDLSNCYFIDTNLMLGQIGRMHAQDDAVNHGTHASFMVELDMLLDEGRVEPPRPVLSVFDGKRQVRVAALVMIDMVADNLKILRRVDTVKLIIVDLDDTLWRGVAAEADAQTWRRTEGWPLAFVEALLYFKRRGGLLAICSKNDHVATVGRLRDIWRDRITLEDFAAVRINWQPKSENVAEILNETNLLPENALFIDDNPREIDEVRSHFPTLRCLSGSPYDWRRIILRAPETQVPFISAESRQRTELVRARVERERQARTMSRMDWLASLELEQTFLLVQSVDAPLFPRTMELVNKTNQFNTTGRRWSLAEFAAFFAHGGVCVLSALRDRTADNGITGIAVVRPGEIVQVVLSCRVFGLGSELGLGHVATLVALRAAAKVVAEIVDTGRNFTSHGYYRDMGFELENGRFVNRQAGTAPAWIRCRFDGDWVDYQVIAKAGVSGKQAELAAAV